MKYFLYIYLLFSFCFIISCQNKEELSLNNVRSLDLSTENFKRQKLDFGDYYQKVDGYQLDSSNNGLIGRISKLMIFDNCIYILDPQFAKKLLVFKLDNGHHLFSLGNKGKGPGEFISLSDFEIDEKKKEIIISDIALSKIVFFDLQGKFLRENKLNFNPVSFAKNDENFYFLIQPNKKISNCMFVTNENFEIKKKYFNSRDYPLHKASWLQTPFYRFKSLLLLKFPYCDTIFSLNKEYLNPYIILKSGSNSINKKINLLSSDKFNDQLELLNKCIGPIYSYYENEQFILILYQRFDKLCIYSFIKKEEISSPMTILTNSLIPSIIPAFYDSNLGNVFYLSTQRLKDIRNFKFYEKSKYSSRLVDAVKNIDYNGNPFIFFIR